MTRSAEPSAGGLAIPRLRAFGPSLGMTEGRAFGPSLGMTGLRRRLPAWLAPLMLVTWLAVPGIAQTTPARISWNHALDQPPAWYATAEAVRIADNLLLYQHDNGGWEKNIDMARPLADSERTRVGRTDLEGGTTIDNGATYTQVRYVARVYEATRQERFRRAMLRGVDFLLAAQYPNGGWPQFHPIRQGYYEHVTFNDGAMIGVMRVLRDVAQARPPFASVDAERRRRSAVAIAKGLEVILKTQVEVGGELTAWCAQYDHTTLRCAKSRAYELPSLSGGESADVVRYLMEVEQPTPAIVRAVESAVRWFDAVKLTGIAVVVKRDSTLARGVDRVVVVDPSAPPLWARFYEIGTNRPMFVGRDGIVRDSLAQIEHERRIGYNYLGGWARELLAAEYPAWRRRMEGKPMQTANAPRRPMVRLAELEIDPSQLDRYLAFLREEIEASIRLEPGVLTLYAVQLKRDPTRVRLFEMYADSSAYEAHIASSHFRKYKVGTEAMVKSLVLLETDPILLGTKGSDVLDGYVEVK